MQAMVLDRPSTAAALHLDERPDPEPGPGEVALAVQACGVCRTDLQLCDGDLEAHRLPIVPGHQIVGTVTAVGSDAPDDLEGRTVGVAWIAGSCGTCRFCTSGRENLCEQATFTGWDRDGGFATGVTARADFVYPLPDGLDPVAVAPLLCGGAIGQRCLRVVEARAGDRLGLFGFGASATIVLQIALHLGCEVHVCTRSEAEQERARSMGATWAGGYDDRPPVALDKAITFAPVGDVVVQALERVDRGGVVAVNAIHLDRVPEFPYELLWWERQIRSIANVTRADVRELLELAAAIPLETTYEVHDLDRANEALRAIRDGTVDTAAVLQP